jgi:hypothetical protein
MHVGGDADGSDLLGAVEVDIDLLVTAAAGGEGGEAEGRREGVLELPLTRKAPGEDRVMSPLARARESRLWSNGSAIQRLSNASNGAGAPQPRIRIRVEEVRENADRHTRTHARTHVRTHTHVHRHTPAYACASRRSGRMRTSTARAPRTYTHRHTHTHT